MKTIECVPNFSEGCDPKKIEAIADVIRSVSGVSLLNVDPGVAANRTVYTFIGEPEAVVEAAFRAVKTASEVIDMRVHTGEHPRIGATDVLPLIPISDISLEETAELARGLAKRISEELFIPIYCYEAAAFKPERRNLAYCRQGEYEGLFSKLATAEGTPDFGKAVYTETVARSGLSVVGARDFLIAVNFNLNTTSVPIADKIAAQVRESGRIVRDNAGNRTRIKGTLEGCKAIGWYIEEYGKAQVSMNITDISKTSLHKAYEEVSRVAEENGVKVTGTEIIGMVPLRVMVEAGKYFSKNCALSDIDSVLYAIQSMNLYELAPFDPAKKIIEYNQKR